MESRSGIYRITCTATGKIYVGSAVNLKVRKRAHFYKLSIGKHVNKHLQNAYNLHGRSSFEFAIIEFIASPAQLLQAEQKWIDLTDSANRKRGFNICRIAGSSFGVRRSSEYKEKIRLANLNRSEEVKQKTIAAIKAANTGRPAWNKGLKVPCQPGRKTNKGKRFVGRKFTPEGYAKICDSNRKPRGKAYSENRSKLSSKSYIFISPNGTKTQIENLSKFCDDNGLNKTRMYQVHKGNEPHHRQWTVK